MDHMTVTDSGIWYSECCTEPDRRPDTVKMNTYTHKNIYENVENYII